MDAFSLRKGEAILFKGELYILIGKEHIKPGKGPAYIQADLKNVKNGKIIKNRFRSSESVELVRLDSKKVQYLYTDGSSFHFMDLEDYSSITINEDVIGDDKYFLIENMELEIMFYEHNPIEIKLPAQVALKVIHTGPGFKGDSVTNKTKEAELETGLTAQVPLFIEEGEMVNIETETGKYTGRS